MPYAKKYQETLYSKAWLERVYVDENRNASQVAALIGCDKSAVTKWLRKLKIKIKTASEAQKLVPRSGSSAPRPRARFRETLHDAEWIREKHGGGWTATDIADAAGSSVPSACRALAKHVGPDWNKSNTDPATLAKMRGRQRARILYPDKQPCLVCGDPKGEINHIDFDPTNNDPKNIEWLCRQHHLMVDKRRTARAAQLFIDRFPREWNEIHNEVLAEVKADPAPKHSKTPRRRQQADRGKS